MKRVGQDMPFGKGVKSAEDSGVSKNRNGNCTYTSNPTADYGASGWLGKLFFCWINPVTVRCLSGTVDPKELPPLCYSDQVEMKRGALENALYIEEKTCRNPSILRATLRQFWPAILTAALWSMLRETLSFTSTFLLRTILKDEAGQWQRSWKSGLIAAGLLSALQLILIFVDGHLDFYSCRTMVRVETALLTSLYKRMLHADGFAASAVSIRLSGISSSRFFSTSSHHSQLGGAGGNGKKERKSKQRIEQEDISKSKGGVFSIVFVDIPSIAEMVLTSVDLIILPIRIALVTTLLVMQVGASSIPGVLTLVILILITVVLEVFNGALKVPFMRRRDARIERSHECLKEMRTLRLLGWEDIAEDIVNKQRTREMKWRSLRMYLSGISYCLTSVAGMVATVATFAAYTIPFIQGKSYALNMRPELVIPVIYVMDNFIGPLADLPYAIATLIEGKISLDRIRHFLFRPQYLTVGDTPELSVGVTAENQKKNGEIEPLLAENSTNAKDAERGKTETASEPSKKLLEAAQKMLEAINDPKLKVRFVDATFSWISPNSTFALSGSPADVAKGKNYPSPVLIGNIQENDEGQLPALDRITLDIKCGELLLVTGSPGSGKSTLVQAVLQKENLRLVAGSCYVSAVEIGNEQAAPMNQQEAFDFDGALMAQAPIGYIPQETWLCGGTVRENILFGDAFHLPTYNAVVRACELENDFKSWRHGDLRVIDEGGLDLSGGQRVRVSIARAIYSCKMHQMQMAALGSQAETAVESRQKYLADQLMKAVAREAEGSEVYRQFKDRILSSSSQASQKASFPCLFCFDDCFNSLDLSVAGHVFHNLFGPNGILEDCAVLVCLNDSSLMGLIRQHAGQAEFHTHRTERSVEDTGKITQLTDSPRRMKVSVCRMARGAITWRGGVLEFWKEINEAEFAGRAKTIISTIENLLAVQEPCILETAENAADTAKQAHKNLEFSEEPFELRTLAVAEHGSSGRVRASSYLWYLKHIGRSLAVMFFLIVTCASVSDVASDLWLTKWTALDSAHGGAAGNNAPYALLNRTIKTKPQQQTHSNRSIHAHFLWMFVSIALFNIIFEFGERIVGVSGSIKAAEAIHKRLWKGVCNAPMWFYDQNPIGRILNRFSTDISIIDCGILRRMGYAFVSAVSCVLSVLVLSVACKWVIPVWPIILVAIYVLIFRYFRSTTREVQRASLLSFSPLCSCFSECMNGREVIAALRKQRFFLRDMTHHLDLCQRTKQMQWGINSWCNIRLQLMLFPLVVMNSTLPGLLQYGSGGNSSSGILTATDAPTSMNHKNIGLIGLAISYSISIASALRRFLNNVTIMEKEMCSVERVQSYLTETEGLARIGASSLLDASRQATGTQRGNLQHSAALPTKRSGLQLLNVEVRYRASTAEETEVSKDQPMPREALPLSFSKAFTMQQLQQQAEQPEKGTAHPSLLKKYQDLEAAAQTPEDNELVNEVPTYFLKPSIRNLSAHIKVGEKIGIVGRTGAGKSTLLQALYGLLPCHAGAIFLDGIRLDCLPRQVLRSVVGFLPQRSVVFEGWTVRDVLDPRHQHTDDTLWEALRAVGLASVVESLPGGEKLETILLGETHKQTTSSSRQGTDRPSKTTDLPAACSRLLSAQQLRYLALGRLVASAPKLRVVLIDEPPAEELWSDGSGSSEMLLSVGSSTALDDGGKANKCRPSTADILEKHFKDCCVVMVAHHLASLRGCDRLWVLSNGCKVGECLPEEIDTEQKFNSFIAKCTKHM